MLGRSGAITPIFGGAAANMYVLLFMYGDGSGSRIQGVFGEGKVMCHVFWVRGGREV